MASLYICLYCTILTTLTWLTCWSISRWCYLQSTALAGLCSMNAKTCKCIFPILWHTSLSNKIFWWIVVEVLSERLCWMSKRQFKRKYDILRHDLYSTMWSNVLLSHRRWQIWWKMQHGLERAANNNNKQTQHKWNLEKVILPTTLIPELYTPVTRRPLCQQISDIICPHWFLWAHILTELTRGLGRGCSLNWLLFLVFVFVSWQFMRNSKASNVKKTAGKSATSHVDSLRLLTELRDNATYPSLETILNDSSSVWCTPGSVAWQDRLTS